MVKGGSKTCIKYLLFVFNLIFVLCGIVLIIIGGIITQKDLTHFLDNKYVTAPVIIIAVGVVTFVVAFFGCCGAVREHRLMLNLFGVLVFIIFIAEIGGGIAAYMYKGHVENFLKQNMNTSLAMQKNDSVKIWDHIQKAWQCCGIDGVEDYVKLKINIPNSCCDIKESSTKDETQALCSEGSAWKIGCFDQTLEKIKGAIAIVCGAAFGLGLIELLGCIFAWCLASAIKRDYEEMS